MKKFVFVVSVLVLFLFCCMTHVQAASAVKCEHTNMIVTVVKEQPADCYHTYYKEVVYSCNDCDYRSFEITQGNDYKHGEIEFVDHSTPATCVEQGWLAYSYVCKKCGQKVGGGMVPRPNVQHPVDKNGKCACYETRVTSVAGNCDSYGFVETTVWCTECNCEVSKTVERTPMSEHFWSEWSNNNGVLERHCISCGKTETQPGEHKTADMATYFKNIFEKFRMFFERILQLFRFAGQ